MKLSTEALAGRAARHPWLTIGIWIAIVVVAVLLIFSLLSDALTTEIEFTGNPESKRGFDLVEDRLRDITKANEVVIVRSPTMTVDDPAFRSFVVGLYGEVVGLGSDVIESGFNYYQVGAPSLVSADRHTTIMPFIMAGSFDRASENIHRVHAIVDKANAEDAFQALITGEASMAKDFEEAANKDLQTGEIIGIPAALIVLVLVFGAIAAAGIPVLLALVSIGVALGITALIGVGFDLSVFVVNIITGLGLAFGLDYSLFILSRYREERRKGKAKIEAITVTGATANRTVLFSGMMVVLALLGMLIVPISIFISLAAGAILVVITAVLAAQTLLPAVLSLLGDRVNALRIPVFRRSSTKVDGEGQGGFWSWVARTVMGHPVISLVLSAGLLVAAAIPAFSLHTGAAGITSLPDGFESKEGFLILNQEFPGGLATPARIVIDGDIDSAPVQQGIANLETALEAHPIFVQPFEFEVNASGDLALLSVPMGGDSLAPEAIEAVRQLRQEYVPEAFSGVDAKVLVTGYTAANIDYFDMTDRYIPIVFAFVLGLSFILLTVVFRSLVVPAKAILMNLLSVGAAYGLIVLVFQKGVAADFFGFQKVDTIEAWLPIFLFSVLFGLSMDYHVFLLSRIRERFDQTQDTAESVAFGLRSTGRVITGAALIMVAVFAGFAAGDLVMLQQLGFGLGVAVFLDATVVRSVLVPSAMRLLGKVNWYLPKFLKWLPKIYIGETG